MFNINKKIISLSIIIVILAGSFLGLMQAPASKSVNNSISLIRLTMGGPARTISLLNNYILKLASVDSTEKAAVPTNDGSGKNNRTSKLVEILIFTFQSVLLSNQKVLFLILFLISIRCLTKDFKKKEFSINRKADFLSRCRYYMRMALKFLTPLQKCMISLLSKYDQNPIYKGVVCLKTKSPCLASDSRTWGFFFV
ncbi:hypothetical protein ACFLR5_01355 [Elusimicrobiota bacterium]